MLTELDGLFFSQFQSGSLHISLLKEGLFHDGAVRTREPQLALDGKVMLTTKLHAFIKDLVAYLKHYSRSISPALVAMKSTAAVRLWQSDKTHWRPAHVLRS